MNFHEVRIDMHIFPRIVFTHSTIMAFAPCPIVPSDPSRPRQGFSPVVRRFSSILRRVHGRVRRRSGLSLYSSPSLPPPPPLDPGRPPRLSRPLLPPPPVSPPRRYPSSDLLVRRRHSSDVSALAFGVGLDEDAELHHLHAGFQSVGDGEERGGKMLG